MIHTLLDSHATLLLVGFDLIPEHHAHLAVFGCPCDIHLALFLKLLDCLRCLLPTLFQCTNGQTTPFPCLALDLSQE